MTRVKWQHVVLAAIASLAFWTVLIVNADYFRKLAQPDFSFGEVEMLRVLASINQERTWSFSYAGSDYQVELALRQEPGADVDRTSASLHRLLLSRAFACGSRTFRQTASACWDTTSVPLEGTLALRRRTGTDWSSVFDSATVEGQLDATGRSLGRMALLLRTNGGYLELHSADARHFRINVVQLSDAGPGGTRLSLFVP